MNPKTMSVLGLGALAASSLFRNNRVDAKPEFTIPGILVNTFVSEKYKVSFDYPKTWVKNPRYEDKYEGVTGFFEVSDFSGIGENIDRYEENGKINFYSEIDRLENHLKNTVILKYYYDLTYEMISEILGIKESTLKMYIRKSLKIMKGSLTNEGNI